MSGLRQFFEPLDFVVKRHLDEAIARGGIKRVAYAEAVRAEYLRTVAPGARVERPFQDPEAADSPAQAMDSNCKRIWRYWDPDEGRPMPAQLLRACVDALPEPERTRCSAEMVEQFMPGLTQDDEASAPHAVECPARMMESAARACQTIAEMARDGTFNYRDSPLRAQSLMELRAVRAMTRAVERKIRSEIPE